MTRLTTQLTIYTIYTITKLTHNFIFIRLIHNIFLIILFIKDETLDKLSLNIIKDSLENKFFIVFSFGSKNSNGKDEIILVCFY